MKSNLGLLLIHSSRMIVTVIVLLRYEELVWSSIDILIEDRIELLNHLHSNTLKSSGEANADCY